MAILPVNDAVAPLLASTVTVPLAEVPEVVAKAMVFPTESVGAPREDEPIFPAKVMAASPETSSVPALAVDCDPRKCPGATERMPRSATTASADTGIVPLLEVADVVESATDWSTERAGVPRVEVPSSPVRFAVAAPPYDTERFPRVDVLDTVGRLMEDPADIARVSRVDVLSDPVSAAVAPLPAMIARVSRVDVLMEPVRFAVALLVVETVSVSRVDVARLPTKFTLPAEVDEAFIVP